MLPALSIYEVGRLSLFGYGVDAFLACRDRLIAIHSGAMLMDFDMACINHEPFKVRLIDENLKKLLPYAFVAPTAKTAVCVFPIAIV